MPWSMRLVFLACGLGLLSVVVLMIRLDVRLQVQCRVHEQPHWERTSVSMCKQPLDKPEKMHGSKKPSMPSARPPGGPG